VTETLNEHWYSPFWCQKTLKILAGRADNPSLVPLRYNSAQRRMNNVVMEEVMAQRAVRIICLKMRQEAGISTWCESLIYSRLRRFPDLAATVISHDPTGTGNLYSMFQRFQSNDPGAPQTKHQHQQGLSFDEPHNSQVVIQTAAKKFAGSGSTINMLHISELAKWPFPKDTMLSLMMALSNSVSSFAMIESTAWGAGGDFHERWNDAEQDPNKLRPGQWRGVFIPWHEGDNCLRDPDTVDMADFGVDDRYNFYEHEEDELMKRFDLTMWHMAWRRFTIDDKCGGDVILFHQENPSTPEEAFISGGTPRFAMRVLQEWYRDAEDPDFVGETALVLEPRTLSMDLTPDGAGWLRIWYPFEEGHRYVIGADCAGSEPGGDENAAAILDVTGPKRRLAATIHGIRGADLYARALANVGYIYGEATIAVEVNGVGEAVQSHLRHFYPERSLYHRVQIDRATRRPGVRIGWYTGHITRQNIIEDLDAAVRDETLEILDEDTVLEFLNFQRVPGARNGEHKLGSHDDRVFGVGIAIQAADYTAAGEYPDYDAERHLRPGPPMAIEAA
jgi:hypothetical protein